MSALGKLIDAPLPPEEAHAQVDAPAADATVLVIDDVPYLLDLASLFLGRAAQVETAVGGPAGLDRAREIRPDLIVCDDFMPAIDGYELCRAVRNDATIADTPFIMLLSDPGAKAHGAAIRAGATDVLAKPLERLSLLGAVKRLLAHTQARGLPRVETDLPVTVTTRDAEGSGTLRNMSRGGAFVETDLPLACTDEVGLRFRLPDGSFTLHPNAQVVWKRARYESVPTPDGAGLRFVEIDAASTRAIDDYVYERDGVRMPIERGL